MYLRLNQREYYLGQVNAVTFEGIQEKLVQALGKPAQGDSSNYIMVFTDPQQMVTRYGYGIESIAIFDVHGALLEEIGDSITEDAILDMMEKGRGHFGVQLIGYGFVDYRDQNPVVSA